MLIVAVLADGGEMGAGQFDRLREALKTAPADLAAMYRFNLTLVMGSQVELPAQSPTLGEVEMCIRETA